MKKSISVILLAALSLTLLFGMTGCGEEQVTLTNKTVNGLSFDVPDDFSDFAEKQSVMVASNEESTASIAVSPAGDAAGYAAGDWTEESYAEATIPSYSDVTFLEFDTDALVSGLTAVYAHFTAKNSSGVELETYNYLIYFPVQDGDSMFQSITFTFNKDASTSLKSNIDTVISSLKVE